MFQIIIKVYYVYNEYLLPIETVKIEYYLSVLKRYNKDSCIYLFFSIVTFCLSPDDRSFSFIFHSTLRSVLFLLNSGLNIGIVQ